MFKHKKWDQTRKDLCIVLRVRLHGANVSPHLSHVRTLRHPTGFLNLGSSRNLEAFGQLSDFCSQSIFKHGESRRQAPIKPGQKYRQCSPTRWSRSDCPSPTQSSSHQHRFRVLLRQSRSTRCWRGLLVRSCLLGGGRDTCCRTILDQ
jgi:hypothetical protein